MVMLFQIYAYYQQSDLSFVWQLFANVKTQCRCFCFTSLDSTVIETQQRQYSDNRSREKLCYFRLYKLDAHRTKYDFRKYFFTNRNVVYVGLNVSNSLPNTVVMSETVNQFKSRLDKFWSNQDLIYNYKAELTGVGNRSSIWIVSIFTYLSALGCGHRGFGLRPQFSLCYYAMLYV